MIDRGSAERSGAGGPLRSRIGGVAGEPRLAPHPLADALERWPPAALLTAAAVLTAGVALLDGATGGALLLPLYLVPVLALAWGLGRGPGVGWSFVAVGAALVATTSAGERLSYWDAAAQLTVLIISALLVSAVRDLKHRSRRLAGTDPLTRALDGRAFEELVELERSRSLRYNRPFTLAYITVDRLRAVNELRGRSTGDRTLALVAHTIRENLRSMDSVARLGGDEFALLLPETGEGAAEVALSKIRSCLDQAVAEHRVPVSFSIGAVICVGAPQSVERLIRQADALMYRVKETGGDGLAVEVLDDGFGIEAILQRG